MFKINSLHEYFFNMKYWFIIRYGPSKSIYKIFCNILFRQTQCLKHKLLSLFGSGFKFIFRIWLSFHSGCSTRSLSLKGPGCVSWSVLLCAGTKLEIKTQIWESPFYTCCCLVTLVQSPLHVYIVRLSCQLVQ